MVRERIKDFTVNVKFSGQFNSSIDNFYRNTGGFVNLPGSSFIYGSLNEVKNEVKAKAQAFVDRAVRNAENRQKQLIACGDGHILVVAYEDGWFYSIASDSREHQYADACMCGSSFDETCERARTHAEQCFDGVVWENRL